MAGPNVRFDGWLSEAALRDAYRECRALIQAHEEDFGIAPVEALASGRPVIALGRGGAREVVAADCGVLYDEPTDGGLERAIAEFETRSFDTAALRASALRFGREAHRDQMVGLLAEAWGAFSRRGADPFPLDRVLC
jgi:glycosyltransferase involved in cell wall biosynthesis